MLTLKNKIKTIINTKSPSLSFLLNQALPFALNPLHFYFLLQPSPPLFLGLGTRAGQSPRQLAGGGRSGGRRPAPRRAPEPPTPRDQNPQETPSLPLPTAACHGRHRAQARAAVAGHPRPSPAKYPKPRSTPYTR